MTNIYEGNMTRPHFLWIAPLAYSLPLFAAFVILKLSDFEHSSFETGFPLGMLVIAITIVLHLVFTSVPVVRRLNDAGKDRSLVGLLLIPVLDIFLLFYLLFLPTAPRQHLSE